MGKSFKYVFIFLLVAGLVTAAWFIYKNKFSKQELIPEPISNAQVDTLTQQPTSENSRINLREILHIPNETDFEVTDSTSAEQLIIAGLYKQSHDRDTSIQVSRENKISKLIERSKFVFSKKMNVTLKSSSMFLNENFNVQFWTNAFFQPVYYVNTKNEIQLFGVEYSDSLKLTIEEKVIRAILPGKVIKLNLYN